MSEADKGKLQASFQISRQLDQEKISFLSNRIGELLKSNNDLRTSASRNEKDTHDIVLYFQREMEMKDEIITKLNEELVKRETQLKFELEKMKKKFEGEINDLKSESENTISSLTTRLTDAEAELSAVDMFVNDKQAFMLQLQRLESEVKQQRQQMFDALDEQERKFLEEKSHLLKDLDEQRAMLQENALRDARNAMGAETKKIRAENNRMHEEVKFLLSTTTELQTDKGTLESQLSMARREVAILTEKEVEYAKQSFLKTKEIKSLRERVEFLEKQSVVNIERFKQRTKELKATVQKDLEVATLDAAGLRRLLKMKNLELRQMKSLAATILSQRSDTEQFFLEALEEVRDVIRKERKKTSLEEKIILNKLKGGSTQGLGGLTKLLGSRHPGNESGFPQINVKGSNLHHFEERKGTDLTLSDTSKVDVKDLTWEDKELVLRVLFAKMNDQQRNVETVVSQTAAAIKSEARRMPNPVFISEGAYLPPDDVEDAAMYQANFEIGTESGYDNDEEM